MTTQHSTPIDTRLKISALWVSVLFVFAYVDIFAFFRADVIDDVMQHKVAIFTIDQTFLLLTTIYILIPSLMVSLTLFLSAKANKWTNVIVAVLYAFTIAGSCVGETWLYFWLGSVVEVILLLVIIRLAWTLKA